MLRHLRVTNFAILSDLSIELGPGFNALTGETGAGKSLIVEAVNLLRGGRASADIPRTGADEAVVEAIFELTDLVEAPVRHLVEEAGLPHSEGELLVRRVIHKGGRSRTYINGALTTATRLSQIGAFLVDLSGQHQHQGLVDPKRHRDILDSFAKNGKRLAKMRSAYEELAAVESELESARNADSNRSERIDYLRFQLSELEAAELRAGEEDELETEHMRLAGVDKLQSTAAEVEALLYGDQRSACDQLDLATRLLEQGGEIDGELGTLAQQVAEARTLAEDAARSVQGYARRLDADPSRLREVDERLTLIRRLTRKHSCTLDALVLKTEELQRELEQLDRHDDYLAELSASAKKLRTKARAAAKELDKHRRKAASKVEKAVLPKLADLGMASARLVVHVEECELGASGANKVEFLLSANAGEAAKPLSRVASGGELSRIMLALKLVLRQADSVACYVFDEVDTGIGGATAEVVGQQIRDVADQRQVLCVTHLPQIAAFGDAHFHVSKSESNGRTETAVNRLSPKERQAEIARMVGGVKVTAQARAHAKAMLAAARERAN